MTLRYLLSTCIFMLAILNITQAQTPTYQFTNYAGTFEEHNAGGKIFRQQSLYTSANFPGVPSGRVKALYVRVAEPYSLSNTGGGCKVDGFTVKIGNTFDSAFNGSGVDTFRTGLTTIYGPDTFSIACSGNHGLWIRIPVKKGNFQYSHEGAKFAVEITCGPQSSTLMEFPRIMNSIPSPPKDRTLIVFDLSEKTGGTIKSIMDLGFDLGQPADVEGLSTFSAFGLFPNPSTDGRFNVSFEAQQAIKDVTVTITNVTGQSLLRQHHSSVGNTFFSEIDLGATAPGIYFVELLADGERIVRRVVVQ